VGGNRERTDGVRKFRDRGSLEQNASYSRNTTQFGALDATSGQPLHVSSRSSRVDDAAAPRRAISHRFSRVFGGRLTCLRDRTLTRRRISDRVRRILPPCFYRIVGKPSLVRYQDWEGFDLDLRSFFGSSSSPARRSPTNKTCWFNDLLIRTARSKRNASSSRCGKIA
jgi:hypothetical protein